MYEHSFVAAWGDMDFNAHMANRAYLDRAADVRLHYFAAHGFPIASFAEQGFGPVVMRETLEYFREIKLHEPFRGTLELAGLSDDGSRFLLRNAFFREDGRAAARIDSLGGWLDLGRRALRAPPEGLLAAMQELDRTEDFEALPSSLRR